jgi:hypothetical protein
VLALRFRTLRATKTLKVLKAIGVIIVVMQLAVALCLLALESVLSRPDQVK